jgi:CRP/FNR family transcriptional regulator
MTPTERFLQTDCLVTDMLYDDQIFTNPDRSETELDSRNLLNRHAAAPSRQGGVPLYKFRGVHRTFAKHSVIFVEGEQCYGLYLLKQGRVKLSIASPEGKATIVGVAEGGSPLGLSAAIAGTDHETTAEAMEACEVEYVRRTDLMALLNRDAAAAVDAAIEINRLYRHSILAIRSLANTSSVLVKLGRLILSWGPDPTNCRDRHIHIINSFTHQQISEMIGSSRETVTRALKELRERGILTLKGKDLHIQDLVQLTALAKNGNCDVPHRRNGSLTNIV